MNLFLVLRPLGAAGVLILIAGCELPFGGCAPDNVEERLELWTAGLDGSGRERLYTDWMYGNPVDYHLAGLSPDGRSLFYRSGYPEPGLYALDLDSLTTRQILSDGWVDYPAVSPDGRQIAYVSATREIWVASLENGEKELILQDTTWLRELMWLPDGSSIAYVRNSAHFDRRKEGGVWLLNLETRHSERLTYTAPGWFDINPLNGTVVYSADTVSVEGLHQMIFVKKAGDDEATAVADGEVPRFTADGRRIYFLSTSLPNGPDSILVSNLDGSNLRVLYSGSQIEAVPLLIDEGRSLFVRTYDTLLRASLSTGSTTVLARAEQHRVPDEETGWESVTPGIDQAVLHGSRVYYFVTKRYFDDGC